MSARPEPGPGCPDESIFVELLQGALSEQRRAQLDQHLDTCRWCLQLVVDLTQLLFPEDPPTPDPPRLLNGRYELLEQVGAGGMGVVYLALDTMLMRKVAIKLLRADVIEPGRREAYTSRLIREAQLLAAVNHPNVLTVHDVGTHEGLVFLVLHFVQGSTLAGWLRQTTPPWRRILEVFLDAGRGLSAAHGCGLIHRDVKPNNILMGPNGEVWVTDFGLARSVGSPVDVLPLDTPASQMKTTALTTTTITRTGDVLGTPAYMSPEQHRGEAVDARSDQFSFCASLFEALYRVRPFPGQTLQALSAAVCSGEGPQRPKKNAAPSALFRVLHRGLSLDPAQRYPDMNQLLAALSRHLASRRRVWITSALLLVIVVVIGRAMLESGATEAPNIQTPAHLEIDPLSPQMTDEETPLVIPLGLDGAIGGGLTIEARAANETLALAFSASADGDAHALKISPTPGHFGEAEVTVIATNGAARAETSFSLTVTRAPRWTGIQRFGDVGMNGFEQLEILDDGRVIIAGYYQEERVRGWLVFTDIDGLAIQHQHHRAISDYLTRGFARGAEHIFLASQAKVTPNSNWQSALVEAIRFDGTSDWRAQIDIGDPINTTTGTHASAHRVIIAADGSLYAVGNYLHGGRGVWGSFLAHILADGRVDWVDDRIGPSEAEGGGASTVALDDRGSLYLAGTSKRDLSGEGQSDAYLQKRTLDGAVIWTQQWGTGGDDTATDLVIVNDSMYITGYVSGLLGETHHGGRDVYLRKMDLNGDVEWTRQLGGPHSDIATDMTTDPQGRLIVAGITCRDDAEDCACFVARFNVDGTRDWLEALHTPGETCEAFGVATFGEHIFVVGRVGARRFQGGRLIEGKTDAFVAHIGPDGRAR